jgi:hypothetical protein
MRPMEQNDIRYIVETLEEAIDTGDWSLIEETRDYLINEHLEDYDVGCCGGGCGCGGEEEEEEK